MKLLKTKKGQLLVCAVAAIAAVLFVEWFSNRKLLSLPSEQTGVHQLSLEGAEAENAEATEDGLVLKENSQVQLSLDDRYVDRFVYTAKHTGPMDAIIKVGTYNDYGQEIEKEIGDACPQYLDSSYVVIRGRVRYITISFVLPENGSRGNSVTLTGAALQNQFVWNGSRMLFTAAVILLTGILWIFRGTFARSVEKGFFTVGLCLGLLMILFIPANKVGWDEEIHFYRAYCIASYPEGISVSDTIYREFVASEATWPYNQPDTKEENEAFHQYLNETADYHGTDFVQGRTLASIYTPGYLSQALFLKIGLLLKLPFSWLFRLGRLGNLLFYLTIMYFAIKILPVGKRILSVIGLMPTTLYLACVYAYDPTVTACVGLGMAIVIRELVTPEKQIDWKSYWICGIAMVFGILPKAVYAPLVLLALLLPKEKFKDNRQRLLMKGGVVLAFLFLMATFVLPTLLNPGAIGDDRGGATSGASQISLILSNPLAYVKILAYEIWTTLPEYLCGSQVFGQLGHLKASPAGLLMPILALTVFFTDREKGVRGIKIKEKVWFFLCCGTCMVLVWTALYLAYTIPGASRIAGVQARYYMPLLLPVAMIFYSDKISVAWNRVKYQTGLYMASAGILFWTIYECIYVPFCR